MNKSRKFDTVKVLSFLTLLSWVGGYAVFDANAAEPMPPPSISEVVLLGIRPPGELNCSNCPEEGRACVKAYLETIAHSSVLGRGNFSSGPEDAVATRRRNLEAQIVAIFGENVRREANLFASATPIMVEWEGMSEGPVDEANFVDQWLTKYPDTPIAAFLHLFRAHRLRAGYEAARFGHEKGLWPILARRYREALDEAKSSGNPLVTCIADDLDAQPYVYLENQGRP